MTQPLVTTVPERCRVCYTCVRECPAKAIRISGGQAEVIAERCIGCGNCVRVCSQQAKRVLSSVEAVGTLLASPKDVAVCLAPSFPVEFPDIDHRCVVGALRALGFRFVHEVAFGADLVAEGYRRLMADQQDRRFIAANCPAVVGYVQRYHPELVDSLAPVVSPMIATARVVRKLYGEAVPAVFIGPCIAKKAEAAAEEVAGDIAEVLTFAELRELLEIRAIEIASAQPSEFDRPHGGLGALLPVSRGLLQAAHLPEDILLGDVVAADGRTDFVEAIREFKTGDLDSSLLEVLCCDGCIAGPGITTDLPPYTRRSLVSRHARRRFAEIDRRQWTDDLERFGRLSLHRRYVTHEQRIPDPRPDEVREALARMGKHEPQDELNCGACGYATCREHAIAICEGLAESEMCLPYTIDRLRQTIDELNHSNQDLASAREALLHSERLASMGQLAAGIAHEVNNPLGVVLMYAHLLLDACEGESALRSDLQTIAEQTDRCKKIVSGLLNFARQQKVARQPVDVRELLQLAARAIPVPPGIEISVEHAIQDPVAELDRDQITQVMVNLITNACDAMPAGGNLRLHATDEEGQIRLVVGDTGEGIPPQSIGKIFEPFFTTKAIGHGTGLGLAVTYGIVKMHGGDIQVKSNADPEAGPTGTTFTVTLPRRGDADELSLGGSRLSENGGPPLQVGDG